MTCVASRITRRQLLPVPSIKSRFTGSRRSLLHARIHDRLFLSRWVGALIITILQVLCRANGCVKAGIKIHAVDALIGKLFVLIFVLVRYLTNSAFLNFLFPGFSIALSILSSMISATYPPYNLSPGFSVNLSWASSTVERYRVLEVAFVDSLLKS